MDKGEQVSVWTNTQGTYLDEISTNKIMEYKGNYYLALCMNYLTEIKPKAAEFVFESVKSRIACDEFIIRATLDRLIEVMYGPEISLISNDQIGRTDPFWNNGYFTAADARIVYAIVTVFKPRRIIEIGSGNSTKWLRRAIKDNSLGTLLTSVDPAPRAEIIGIADEIVRKSVIDVDLRIFDSLECGDVLFWDGCHIGFNGSDVCTLFLDVLPRLKPGVLVQVHDIALPYAGQDLFPDAPDGLRTMSTTEEMMLATFLLNSASSKVLAPVHYLWKRGLIRDPGASFWFLSR